MKCAVANQIDFARRGPVALVVGSENRIALADGDAVGGAETGGDGFGFQSIGRNFEKRIGVAPAGIVPMPAAGVVEISLRVGLEVVTKSVVAGVDCAVVVEIFVEVGLAVVV